MVDFRFILFVFAIPFVAGRMCYSFTESGVGDVDCGSLPCFSTQFYHDEFLLRPTDELIGGCFDPLEECFFTAMFYFAYEEKTNETTRFGETMCCLGEFCNVPLRSGKRMYILPSNTTRAEKDDEDYTEDEELIYRH